MNRMSAGAVTRTAGAYGIKRSASGRGCTAVIRRAASVSSCVDMVVWAAPAVTRRRARVSAIKSLCVVFPLRARALVGGYLEGRHRRLVDHDAGDDDLVGYQLVAQVANGRHRGEAAHLVAVEFGRGEQAPRLDRFDRLGDAADADDLGRLLASR